MSADSNHIKAVPTNIITGFLGAGKTSAILHLLKHKPDNERWAVLVNEFGEIGVDGSLFEGQHNQKQGVFIREVPGGCMCCASGLPMQIALNMLLVKAKPDRLLIEPTGLGHAIEVLQVLSAEHYQSILSLQKVLTLVDARKLKDERYTSHETFNQQLSIADVVVGNKQDFYQPEDKQMLIEYVNERFALSKPIVFSSYGHINIDLLQGATATIVKPKGHLHNDHKTKQLAFDAPIPECGYVSAQNNGEGYQSVGWRFSPDIVFNHRKLFAFLSGLVAERMKGVFITDEGVFGYNLTPDALTEVTLDECSESRMEVISVNSIAQLETGQLETALMSCALEKN